MAAGEKQFNHEVEKSKTPSDQLTSLSRFQNKHTFSPGHKTSFRNPEQERKFFLSEIKHIPTLESHLAKISDVQKQRKELQDERISVSSDNHLDDKQVLNRFHSLLKRDDNLANDQRKLVGAMMNDYAKIKKEIASRKNHLSAIKSQSNKNGKDVAESDRSLELLNYLERRLESIHENPQRWTLAVRLTRSFNSFNNNEKDMRDKYNALLTEKEELERRLRIIEKETDWLEYHLNITTETISKRPAIPK